jgi:hypothetical protein
MKSYLRPARRAVARDCDTEPYAASAKEKAIAYLSTVVSPRSNSQVRSDGNARKAPGILAEWLEVPVTKLMFECPRTKRLVPTSIDVELADIDKLPDRVTFSRCPYCSTLHGWKPKDTWVSEGMQALRQYR